MTKEEERAIIDEIIRIFMEDDDFDIYVKEQSQDVTQMLFDEIIRFVSIF